MATKTNEEVQIVKAGAGALTQGNGAHGDVLDQAITLALEKGTVDALEKILAMRERFEANEARKAFGIALSSFKANPPRLEKVKQVDFNSKSGGRVNYKYAPLDYICAEIGGALAKHGLSFTWNVEQGADAIRVTCVLRHEQGHSESVTMAAGLHDDTRMNSIQRLGATITYLERYSLLAATGLATADEDTDGITMGNVLDFKNNIEAASDTDELKRAYAEAMKAALDAKDGKAAVVFSELRDKKKAELRSQREPGDE